MTNLGKDICRHLKEIRRQIARENDIALDIPECTYKGDCSGTCPRCEYELHYLESELARRQRLGKAAVVAGTVLTMATFQTANAQEPAIMGKPSQPIEDVDGQGTLKGTVTEKRNDEPLIGCLVNVKQDGKIVAVGRTDFEGLYTIKGLKEGVYRIEVRYVGFKCAIFDDIHIKKNGFTVLDVELEWEEGAVLTGIIVTEPVGRDISYDVEKINKEVLTPDTSRTPVLRINTDSDGKPVDAYFGGVQVELDGTPASTPAEPQPGGRPQNIDSVNPLDKEDR